MRKASWTALILSLASLLSPLAGHAEAQTRSEMSQLKRDMEALRGEVETKNDIIKRMQQRLEALETKMQGAAQPPLEEKLTVLKQEMRTEMKTEMAARAEAASSKLMGGQVFFKGGYVRYEDPRRNSLLTKQDDPNDKEGYQVGAGLDLPLMTLFGNTLLGEILVEYKQSQKTTGDASIAVEDNPDQPGKKLAEDKGFENIFTVAVAPKYRFDNLGSIWPGLNSVRAWIIPVGLTFNVNTPVNKAITNISVGGTSGIGVERMFWNNRVSLGVDFRYYWGPDIPDENLANLTTGAYVGINF